MSNPYQNFEDDNSLPPLNARRTSYASVASGAQQHPWPAAQSTTMGFDNLLNPPTPGGNQQYLNDSTSSSSMRNSRNDSGVRSGGGHSSYLSRTGTSDRDGNLRNSSLSAPWPPPRLGSNFPMSRAFDFFMNKDPLLSTGPPDSSNGAQNGLGIGANPSTHNVSSTGFLAPSYLRGSTYLQQLEEQHKSRILSERERGNAHGARRQSRGGTTSNGTSNGLPTITGKIHGSGTTHRGVSFDVVEKSAAVQEVEEEEPTPLPSRWNKEDKDNALEISGEGFEVSYTGKPSGDHEASAVRADHGINPACGIYYFEVVILNKKKSPSEDMPQIGIGFSTKTAQLSRAPGWELESWGYHGDDGHAFAAHSSGKPYASKFGHGDNIGCLINFRLGHALFTKNGKEQKVAFRDLDFKSLKGKIYPTVGLKKSGDHVWVNFGQVPFMFDIDGYMKRERAIIEDEIRATDTRVLAPSLSETELIQQLVLQFLQHDGYVETARAFAGEIHAEKSALRLNPKDAIKGIDIKDDEDAHKRQSIRSAILEGDIDRAMKCTNEYYPDVLKDNEQVYFRLRCRQFIEMIRKEAELNLAREKANAKKASQAEDDEEMLEADSASDWEDGMDAEDNDDTTPLATISYGQELKREFSSDPRRETTMHLNEIFSLIAYPNPLKVPEVVHLMDGSGRVAVAEELNSAILTSLGKSSRSALENVYAQTSVLLEDLRKDGGPGAFVTLQGIIDQIPPNELL